MGGAGDARGAVMRSVATAAAAVTLLVVGPVCIGSGGTDDSHITFWVADAVTRGWGFVNYDGDAVEQSSSLTLVVLLALLRLVTRLPVPLLGYVLGLVAGAAAVVQAARLASRLAPGTGPYAAWMTATAYCLVYWSTSGMEASLAAALAPTLVLAVGDVVEGAEARRARLVALFVTAIAFTGVRPEYTLVSLGVAAAIVVLGVRIGLGRARVLAAAGVVTASVAAVVGFRLCVFGETLPNPVRAKAGGFDVANGLEYLAHVAIESNLALVVAGAAGVGLGVRVLLSRRARGEPYALSVGLTAALVLALLVFPVAVGGDWMFHGRFLAPAVGVLAVSAAALVRVVPRRLMHAALASIVLVGAVRGGSRAAAAWDRSVGLGTAGRLSRSLPQPHEFSVVELANEAHLRDAPIVLGLLRILDRLGPTQDRPITLASGQGGMVPYYAALHYHGRIRFLDMYSLTSDAVARCWPDAVLQRGLLGKLLSYPKILAAGELERRCGISRPDIVFNAVLPGPFKEQLRDHGYVVIYKQAGFAFGQTPLRGFIAVRRELVEAAGLELSHFYW